MIQAKLVKVDEQMARYFLSLEKQPEVGVKDTNRKWSPGVVNDYAIDMLAPALDTQGNVIAPTRWRDTHQGMAFTGFLHDNTAVFVDGGQRCRAIIQAATIGAGQGGESYPANPDIFFTFMVSEGLTQEDVAAMDIGKRRTPADWVQMQGWANKNVAASVARLCYLYEHVPWSPDSWRKHKITPSMIQSYLDENPRVCDAILEGSRLGKKMIVSSASAGYYEALKSGVDEKLINDFIDALHSGAELEHGSAILALRDMLAKTTKKKRKWTREEQLALFIKAFLKWIKKSQVTVLSFKTGGDAPDRFPRYTD